MNRETLKKQIDSAFGACLPELVLKNAQIVNVFTESVEQGDIAVTDGMIAGIGSYKGENEIDLSGKYVCPGFIDGHIHLESSMVLPTEFEACVLPHGTTAVITDPHEIANVAGAEGIEFMLEGTRDLKLDVFLMLPSCVPDSPLDESGAKLSAESLKPFYRNPRVLGLAEVMDAYNTVRGEKVILEKLFDAKELGKRIDGHAPFVLGKDLNAYTAAGVASDHECSQIGEAMEKLSRGQWIMIREGTAAHNLNALMKLFESPFYQRAMLVTDDKHPGDLLRIGHIDAIIRAAVRQGADPLRAIRMGSLHAAQYFGLRDRGAIAPGYRADMVVLSGLNDFQVEMVFKDGVLAAENGKLLALSEGDVDTEAFPRVFQSFAMPKLSEENFRLKQSGTRQRVIELIPGELLTKEKICATASTKEGMAPGVDITRDIVKLAVAERHRNTGHIGVGFLGGYGLKCGAVASSIAHDSHNLIIAGTNDRDMAVAGNWVRENSGGLAVALDGKIVEALPLPVGGLISNRSVQRVDQKLEKMKRILRDMGISKNIDPFMTLGFVSLPVIPAVRLNTYGVIDVGNQKIVPAMFD